MRRPAVFIPIAISIIISIAVSSVKFRLHAADSPIAKSAGKPETKTVFPPVADLPDRKEIPNPLIDEKGQEISHPEQWESRREEMKRIVEHYLTGTIPPPPGNVKGTVLEEKMVLDGKAKFQRVHLSFGPEEKLGFDVGIFVPEGAGPFPVVVNPSFYPTPITPQPQPDAGGDQKTDAKGDAKSDAKDGEKSDSKNAKGARGIFRTQDPETAARGFAEALNRGYAICTFGYTQAGADDRNKWQDTGFFAAYPDYDWHDLGAWAWAMSRCVDYLEKQPFVDKAKFIAVGHSRLGKTTLVAGAFDERFALVAPAGSGCAGTGAFRVNGKGRTGKEGLEDVCKNFPQWITPRLNDFSGQVEKLPFDQNWLIALVAPRAFIEAEVAGRWRLQRQSHESGISGGAAGVRHARRVGPPWHTLSPRPSCAGSGRLESDFRFRRLASARQEERPEI